MYIPWLHVIECVVDIMHRALLAHICLDRAGNHHRIQGLACRRIAALELATGGVTTCMHWVDP